MEGLRGIIDRLSTLDSARFHGVRTMKLKRNELTEHISKVSTYEGRDEARPGRVAKRR